LAAHTTLPVIGIPVKGGALNGMDALLSMVQMPAGIPVATVTLGSAGPVNAALLAVQILALSRAGLRARLARHKTELKRKVMRADRGVQADLVKQGA
jgi:5-(carboxyamino)imidazole ribonucleotide mutase